MNSDFCIEQAKGNHLKWWNRQGLVLNLQVWQPDEAKRVPMPPEPGDLRTKWADPKYRAGLAEARFLNTIYLGDALPLYEACIGPGSLAEFLGCKAVYEPSTVWYEPFIDDPDNSGPLVFRQENNQPLQEQLELVDEGMRVSGGRFIVAMPDIIENLDILANIRGSQPLLMDLIERPEWVHARQEEILDAFFKTFDMFYEHAKDEYGGSAFIFGIYGPGKTCKVQCDFSCMISPSMFKEFVQPYLARQCDWLDYSMYHLDGETALQHLDLLLEIESLDAIEWTPIGASLNSTESPRGGSPHWYGLYKRIRKAGKSVQAIGVKAHEAIPLIDAVGPEGLYVYVDQTDMATAEKLLQQVEQYR